jgi:hypothetical protein
MDTQVGKSFLQAANIKAFCKLPILSDIDIEALLGKNLVIHIPIVTKRSLTAKAIALSLAH